MHQWRLFYSKREQRMWIGGASVLIAVYASMPLLRMAQGTFSEEIIAYVWSGGFGLIMLSLLWVALSQGRQHQRVGHWMALGLGIIAVYVLLFARVSSMADRTHLIEYSILTAFIYQALCERGANGGLHTYLSARAMLIAVAFGFIDETVQFFLPDRVFDLVDIGFNTLAAGITVVGLIIAQKLRRLMDRSDST